MDGSRFDDLSRALATPVARRGVLGSLLAGVALAIGWRPSPARQPDDCPSFLGNTCAEGEFGCGDGPNGFCPSNACCGGVCTDLRSDDANCGACGDACPDDAACVDGQCAPRCQEPLLLCDGACVDPATDDTNCGGCGAPCRGQAVCVGGSCVCPDGLGSCQQGCVDLQTDPANCGGCGVVCPSGGGCVDGACEAVCPDGTTACGDGCADLRSDVANCGGCGATCPPGSICADGVCEVVCPEGAVACGEVCVELGDDPANCGGCGVACAQGEVCCGGACADLATDPLNCGACGATCLDGTSCVDGSCPAEEDDVRTSTVRDVPAADLCVARPPSADRLLRLARAGRATPTRADALPAAVTPEEAVRLLETGERVDQATREAVTAATWGALGCENAGDPIAHLGTLTDDGIRAAIAERGWTPEILRLLDGAVRAPLPGDLQVGVVGNPAIRRLPDGRVAVRVRLENPLLPRDGGDLGVNDERVYVLERRDDDWRIDRIVPVSRDPATPRLPGEIRVQEALCPPGMGYDDFVAGACPPHHAPGFAFATATYESATYTPASAVVTCCGPNGPGGGDADCCADATWEGETERTLDALPTGTTYWLSLFRGEGEDLTAWVVPGALGISFPSLFADPVTLWGVSLTAARPRALLTAYIFRDASCGTTCAGDEASCPEPVSGISRWVDLSIDLEHCGVCGNACGDGATCVRGRCEPTPTASPEATP